MKIGLVAGNRRLPFQFADWAKRSGYDLYIIGIKGEVDEKLKKEVLADKYLELFVCDLSKGIKFFKQNGVVDVVMIGGIARAKLKLNFDIINVAFRLLFVKNKHKGLFTIIMSIIDKNGIKIRSIQEFMTELLIGEGSLGSVKPSDGDLAAFHKNLGKILDYTRTGDGQAVVIYKGEILACENFKGTDDLMRRAAQKRNSEQGGIMVKIMEPGQDSRVDLPVVGTGTVEKIAEYGLAGIFVEAGRTITDGTAETIKLADEKGVFVYGVKI
jgi:DUF1009 family protein